MRCVISAFRAESASPSHSFSEINSMKKIVTSVFLVLGLALAGGCASTKDLEAVRAVADKAAAAAAKAQATADSAAAAASKAQASADAAKSTSDAAKSTADAAKSSADAANACCKDTQTKIDRMFKKSMYK
ncbi:MAG TPA: alanine-zipper protein [Burkholderiales bacterium]|nr:alanine-zipper protein [Burkholderiales bacterium]